MVRERGRSAVLREATAAFLKSNEAEVIDRRYREGYAGTAGIGGQLDERAGEAEEWVAQGVWPEE